MLNLFAQITDPLAASAPVSEGVSTVFRWARVQENRDWFLPVLIAVLLALYFVRRYRIDASELKFWQRSVLLVLRLAVVLSLLLFYLGPQWERLVGSSRVAILIDTSASMAIHDLQAPGEESSVVISEDESTTPGDQASGDNPVGPTRLDAVIDWMHRSELIDRLLEKHDVVVYSFDSNLRRILQQRRPDSEIADETSDPETPEADSGETGDEMSGLDSLKPSGEQTSLGEAFFELLQRERGRPLAGVVLISDGRMNAGRGMEAPLESAERLRIPIYPIGVGVARQALNFRIGNIDVPDRAFPDDPFTIKVPVELIGGTSEEENEIRTVPVELWAAPEGAEGDAAPESKIGEQELRFAAPGTIEAEFELRFSEAGKRRLTAKILPPEEDKFPSDDQQQAVVEIVDRKDRILMFASGPSRDYQFISSQVHRDKSMSVDVYLPWAKAGTSQNADKILDAFPSTRAEMSEYDVVVAFDANWRLLSNEQIDVLENWVGRQGGGLILVAGAINQADTVTGWVTDMNMEKIRAMYPVEFMARQSAFDHRYHGDTQAWPLQFTRAGEDAEFLRPADDPVEARSFWSEFPGFYAFFAVKGVKPTATLLVASGSPETMGRAETGTLVAEQFYGAGRVLYLGSGELWRLRRVDERSFEQITTRMLRHVAQGRLQRESDRGSLAADKRRYSLGSIAQLRVTANDNQLKPLTEPTLPVDILSPSGTLRTVDVLLDPNVPGTYQAHFPLVEEGTWTIRFTIPESDQQITRTVQVRMSDLERENSGRNEVLLREIAEAVDGFYYSSPTQALPLVKESSLYGNIDFFADGKTQSGTSDVQPITELLKVRSQRAVLDATAEENVLRIFLIVICSLLMVEWTLRRFMKLA